MKLVASSKFPEVKDISEETELETGSVCPLTVSVGTQTDASEQKTEEGANKQYICTGSLTDDILANLEVKNYHSYCTSVGGLFSARAPSPYQDDLAGEGSIYSKRTNQLSYQIGKVLSLQINC